jgi:hypothetical protein
LRWISTIFSEQAELDLGINLMTVDVEKGQRAKADAKDQKNLATASNWQEQEGQLAEASCRQASTVASQSQPIEPGLTECAPNPSPL